MHRLNQEPRKDNRAKLHVNMEREDLFHFFT